MFRSASSASTPRSASASGLPQRGRLGLCARLPDALRSLARDRGARSAAAVWARWRHGQPLADALRQVAPIAVYPAVAIVAFAIFSRVVIGQWFVSGGFFVPENKALGDPMMAAAEIGWGTHMLSGSLLAAIGAAGAVSLFVSGSSSRRRA